MEKILNSTPENFIAEESSFQKLLEDHENWKDIPLINHVHLQDVKDCTLVRFRGMIQDMLDPEFYLEKYEVVSKKTTEKIRIQQGKYRDCLVMSHEERVDHDSTANVHGERRTLFLVSVPGLNSWALDIEKNNLAFCTETTKNTVLVKSNVEGNNQSIKRSCEEEPMEIDGQNCEAIANTKRVKSDNELSSNIQNGSNSNSVLSSEYLINSPISDRPGKACMVKIYNEFEKHGLNTMVDVIGFLSVDPALDGSTVGQDEIEFDDINEFQASNPPPSLIPRIHAVAVRELDHLNPLLDLSITNTSPLTDTFNMDSVYNDLKVVLTQCLFGDILAAEYLICHLISTVYVRTGFETLGQFSLNLCNIPDKVFDKYIEEFYSILESIIPTSHYLPMTLENLNLKQFTPMKDYTTNKLTSGILQLASHTHLVLDETRLQPGKLESSGINAVQSLANLIKNQQIKYNFKFYELEFNTNIPVLIFSEGRSMLPNNFQIPINADPDCVDLIEETLKAAKHYLQPKLNAIRIYLTRAKLAEFKLNPENSELIEKDFVEMRKLNQKTDADDLHKHLVLSRLLGIAQGNEYFSNENWNKAKEMENERISRLKKMPTSKNVRN